MSGLRAALSGWFRHLPEDGGDGSQGDRRGRLRWRRLLGVSLVLFLALSGFVLYVLIPYPWTLASRNPERTALMEQRIQEARDRGDTLAIRREWLPLSEISPNLVRAVIVAEDYRFREHDGVDWVSLAEEVEWSGDDDFSWWSAADLAALGDAVAYVWRHRSELRGRSTLTQQLAKNLYYGTDRSFLRKVLELVVARRLERHLSKDRILELYLNLVEWGPGIFGAEVAAQHYFGTSARSLSLSQAAALAGTLPHPLTSNPARSPGRMQWRRELILDRLVPGPEPPGPLPLPDTMLLPETMLVPDTMLLPDTILLPDTMMLSDTSLRPDTAGRPDTVLPPDTAGRPDTVLPPDTAGRFDTVPRPPTDSDPDTADGTGVATAPVPAAVRTRWGGDSPIPVSSTAASGRGMLGRERR